MSHMCGRSSSNKDRILNVFSKQFKTTDKNCCSVNRSTADSKCSNHYSKTDGQHRAKRLKSRKERGQMRRGGKEAPKSKPHHRHCGLQSSKDITYLHDRCCRSSCHCSSRQDASLSNVVPAAQERSIITDSRLIGHHGLFNHEVKSIDIERLLSKQRKTEQSGLQVHENISTSHPSSTSHIPTPVSSKDLLGAEPDEGVTLERDGDPAMKAPDDCQVEEDKFSQGSDATPGQKTNPVMSEKGIESQLTPTDGRENEMILNKKAKRHVISTLEQTPRNQDSSVHQSQAHDVSPSPFQLPSSDTPGRSDSRHQRKDPSSVSESVCTVAAHLCGCLQLPVLRRKRNMVAESKEVLLKALQERHGPQLQKNLFRLQQCLSSSPGHTKKGQDREQSMMDEDELQYTDAFTTEFRSSKPFFNDQKIQSFKRKGSAHWNLRPSPQLLRNTKQTAEWFRRPEETSASLLDDNLRHLHSPQSCMDFESSGTSDHLFAPSSTSCWEGKKSLFPHWGDSLSRQKSKETFTFDSFENSCMNQTRALDGPLYGTGNIQNFSPYQARLLERRSTEPIHFPQERDPFETERYSFASSFSSQVQHPDQVLSFKPFSHISQPTAYPLRMSHHTDMIHYPSSHMLEREAALSRSSLLSPEPWSFPPMRLY
ncbi:uncharacterized protein si:dkey-250k15.4 [Notolabrus celidotus]|uniref:uncharacterized protein si:dkey-250k15.4 n=1 Tax=Notolabrus celidotus TaxID=1203425 RepID=UPI0014908872|nr:uncharacterized protein si:dkey-250k15.4 [Notolabrus celidotus]